MDIAIDLQPSTTSTGEHLQCNAPQFDVTLLTSNYSQKTQTDFSNSKTPKKLQIPNNSEPRTPEGERALIAF